MSEKSKKNQTIQYYDQNAADFVENTRNVDFHIMQDSCRGEDPGSGLWLRKGYKIFPGAWISGRRDRRLRGTVRVGIRVHGDFGEMPVVPRAGCIGSV